MIHIRASRSALFTLLFASAAFAAGGKNDPKGEPRKDPKEQRESIEHIQSNVRSLKTEQILLRLQAQGMSRAEAIEVLKARLAKRQGDNADEAAAAKGNAKRPAKVKPMVRQKMLAKVVGGKNPHDVRASTMDGDGESGSEKNSEDQAFDRVEYELRDEPIMHDFWASRGHNQDYGSDLISRFGREEREGKSEKQLEKAELKKVGDQPEVGYFVIQTAEERREAMLDFKCEGNVENIRRWRRIAVLDPDASVRLAASDRLRRAGEGLAERFLLKLNFRERSLLGHLDPYDSTTRDFLRSLWDKDLGTEDMRRMAIEILNAFPVYEDWVRAVGEGLNPEIALAAKLDLNFELKPVEDSEADLAHQATLEPKWPILYNPKASVAARIDAMRDRSIDNTPSNMKDWVYVALNDANDKVRGEAETRAKAVSPEAESLLEELRKMREEVAVPQTPPDASATTSSGLPPPPVPATEARLPPPPLSSDVRPLNEDETSRLKSMISESPRFGVYGTSEPWQLQMFYTDDGMQRLKNPRDPEFRREIVRQIEVCQGSRRLIDSMLARLLTDILNEFEP